MTSNNRQKSNMNGKSSDFDNVHGNNRNESSLSGTSTAASACELSLSGTDDMLLRQKIDMDNAVCKICREFEIQPKMGKYLPKLYGFEIVVVCDDSGSMNREVDGTNRTRWNELCSIVKRVVKIGVIFDADGVDIYFLNREPLLNVKDPKVIDRAFQKRPKGFTPLVPVLKKIFESQLARRERNKKLLVFIATDGEPTDKENKPNISEFEHLMLEKRQPDTTYVSFLLCTDDRDCVGYLKKWDQTMAHVDVTDDYETEKKDIRRCRKQPDYPFSYGDYIAKALIGAIVPEIDRLNEPD